MFANLLFFIREQENHGTTEFSVIGMGSAADTGLGEVNGVLLTEGHIYHLIRLNCRNT